MLNSEVMREPDRDTNDIKADKDLLHSGMKKVFCMYKLNISSKHLSFFKCNTNIVFDVLLLSDHCVLLGIESRKSINISLISCILHTFVCMK